jgi:ATP-dependent DNA ligase
MIEPCIPTRATKPPVGPQWIHEIKHDGYRLIARKRGAGVRLFTRNGFRLDEALSSRQRGRGRAGGSNRDDRRRGGVVRWRRPGDFDKLHSRAYDGEVILYSFDLLELHGEDWRPRPLEERKARLAELLAEAPAGVVYTEHMEGDGAAIFAHACRLGAEGIISKHREHPYRSGTSKAWLKTKNRRRLACSGFGKNHDRGARSDQPLHPIL